MHTTHQIVLEGPASFHGHIVEYEKSISDLLVVSKVPSSIPSSHNKESSSLLTNLLLKPFQSVANVDAVQINCMVFKKVLDTIYSFLWVSQFLSSHARLRLKIWWSDHNFTTYMVYPKKFYPIILYAIYIYIYMQHNLEAPTTHLHVCFSLKLGFSID